jgi:hypothetical protein
MNIQVGGFVIVFYGSAKPDKANVSFPPNCQ